MTGCLRISKESIFTGLNNFKVLSMADARFDEQFGFTDSEVRDILEEYGVSDKISEVKDWYDEAPREDGREDIIAYGIAFCRKRCKVVCEKM